MGLGLFARLKKRKTVVPELNKAAADIFDSELDELADDLGFREALDFVKIGVIAEINSPKERKKLVNMMVVQEREPDVIVHLCMVDWIKMQLLSPQNWNGKIILKSGIPYLLLYDYIVDWLAMHDVIEIEQADDLKQQIRHDLSPALYE